MYPAKTANQRLCYIFNGLNQPTWVCFDFHFNTWRLRTEMEFRFNFSCDLEEKDGTNSSNSFVISSCFKDL